MQEHFRLGNNAAKIYQAQKEEALSMKESTGAISANIPVPAGYEVFCNHFQPQFCSSNMDTEVQCSVCLDTGSVRQKFQDRS